VRWFAEAVAAGVPEPEVMCVATASRDGIPSARTVLMKSVDERGFVFANAWRHENGRRDGLSDGYWRRHWGIFRH
jgi:pyridoxamine 5'-phosphate oxidase